MSEKILRTGVDSLYLSYRGTLSREWEGKLEEAKRLARSEDRRLRAQAQISIGQELFRVAGHGAKPFAYVFGNNWFTVHVSRRENVGFPMAVAQVSSEVLTRAGVEAAVEALRFVVGTLGDVRDPASINRVDLCVDFLTDFPLEQIERVQWVTRAKNKAVYEEDGQFTGFMIGRGGQIAGRMYNKTLEIKVSGKEYLFAIWRELGWDGESPVWRQEFQVRRAPLAELGIDTVDDLKLKVAGLWRYLTEDWLRLTVPV